MPPQQVPSKSGPTADGILAAMKDAPSPLEFIKANLKPKAPLPSDIPAQALAEVNAQRAKENVVSANPVTEAAAEAIKETPEYDVNLEPKKEVADEKESKPSVPPVSDTAVDKEPGNDRDENFKKLRIQLGEVKDVVKEKEKEIESLQSKVKRYETGEEFPDVVKQLQEENAKLSRYEKIVALKTSPAYEEKFIKPLNDMRTRLNAIAKDYGIPERIMDNALNIKNRKELNMFLSEHFDDVGAIEVKQLISHAQDIQTQALEAEKEPAQAMESLRQEHEEIKKAEAAKNVNSIIATSKDAWIDSLLRIREEGKARRLIPKEGDDAYNKEKVEPTLRAAGTEYGKIIRMLGENGLKTLPKDLAHAIARMVHLAFESSASIEDRDRAEREAEEAIKNAERTTRYGRPLARGGAISSGEAAPMQRPKNAEAAAEQLINQVRAGRR